ncbi:hypothetical protein OB955_25055 [Halobacteria archaeon AArc-m2/3/4]|uniref:Uncharacterized protein n=1 Tax=Natronoglomus mannanivorans TaxID=2979990 RepID=A0ABT2QLY2_9EURY|nr:hypothetical protein [Halobacteria archaeon AArc-m2/3/4]
MLRRQSAAEYKTEPRSGNELSIDLEDGRTVQLEITGKRARIDVRLDRHWIFGVNDNVAKLVMVLNENGQLIGDNSLPEWIEPLLQRIGLEGVDA